MPIVVNKKTQQRHGVDISQIDYFIQHKDDYDVYDNIQFADIVKKPIYSKLPGGETVTVYTALLNRYDYLREPAVINPDTKYLCYTDDTFLQCIPWQTIPAFVPYKGDFSRANRVHKILSHLFTDTEYSIYIDSNYKILVDPTEIIARLGNADIALFNHLGRRCLYTEARHCMKMGYGSEVDIQRQLDAYQADGYPTDMGLYACGVMVRRNTEKIQKFNEMWWSHIVNYSGRDQISFPYVANKCGLKISVFPGYYHGNDQFTYMYHAAFRSHPDTVAAQSQKSVQIHDTKWERLLALCPPRP